MVLNRLNISGFISSFIFSINMSSAKTYAQAPVRTVICRSQLNVPYFRSGFGLVDAHLEP